MLEKIEDINYVLRHIKRVSTIGGIQYAVGTYMAAFTCLSAQDTQCFRNISWITKWIGTAGAVTIAGLSLGSTLYFSIDKKDKPKILQTAAGVFGNAAGFAGGHVNYLIIISATIYPIIIKTNPHLDPAKVSITNP